MQEFHFIGQIVKHDRFWDLLLAICRLRYPLFWLLRLADTRGGIDKVKYFIYQIDLLMETGLENVLKKWSAHTCLAYKIWSALMRETGKVIRWEILRLRDWTMNVTLGMVSSIFMFRIFNMCELTVIHLYQNQAQIQVQRRILPLNKMRNQMKTVCKRKSHWKTWQSWSNGHTATSCTIALCSYLIIFLSPIYCAHTPR